MNNATKINLVAYSSYLLFYTGYSKAKACLEPSQLIEIITFQKGIGRFLIEMNKVVALVGLTTLCMAFCPYIVD
jgi:hypothetical protein